MHGPKSMNNLSTFGASELVATFRQRLDGRLVDCNAACARMLGYDSREELLSIGMFDYSNASDFSSVAAALQDLGNLSSIEVAVRKKDGGLAWVLQNLKVGTDATHGVVLDGAMFDVTEQRFAVQRFEYQAYHDSLTQLPNRMLFVDRTGVALAQARRCGTPMAVLLLDLDHFDLVNTSFGRDFGDRLLRSVADRLSACVREEDSLARYGDDEFMILLAKMTSGTDAAIAAQRVLTALAHPFVVDGRSIEVHASIGIGVLPEDGTEAEALVRSAAAAMLQAKQRGRNRYQFHEPELNARALQRAAIAASVRTAIDNNELELYYHPEVNVQTGRIECIEALLRWRHPQLGVLGPAAFLDAAEEGGLAERLGVWVVDEACRQARQWHDEGLPDLRIAVNVSSRQLGVGQPFVKAVDQALSRQKLQPRVLEIEIAEQTLNSNSRAVDLMKSLRDLGVRLTIDDFGTGGGSFVRLKEMPIDAVKIAPSFVHHVTDRSDDAAIVRAMILMAKGLDLGIVAEGVETKAQLSYLLDRHCADMQGYFFGAPMPAPALADILRMQQH